jgi:hypothetical protein
MQRYRIGAWLLLALCFSSCKKYLDAKPDDKLFVPATISDLQALLDDDATMNLNKSAAYGETSCDEFFLSQDEYNTLSPADQANYAWQDYNTGGRGSDWSEGYTPVYPCNLVLEDIAGIARTEANAKAWDNVKGSALFFRSYSFLWLLWDYGKAYDSSTAATDWGIALRTASDFNVPSVRATNEEGYRMVINDTKAAIPLLPGLPQVTTRPSKAAAYGLLARCYLSMRDYKDAGLYADSCLQIQHSLMDYNGDEDMPEGVMADAPFKLFNKETIFLSTLNRDYYIYLTPYIGSIDTALVKLYGGSDLRLQAFYSDNADGFKYFKGSYTGDGFNFAGIGTDEMYLVRAECNIRNGQVQAGLNDLNALLAKRYVAGAFQPYTTSNASAALQLVLAERRKELVMRGMRWMDIKRLNKEDAAISQQRLINGEMVTLAPNANFYALPLPDDLVIITGMPQNEP